ncbi:hypothetical protein LG634_11010 [Streptomyces bambusae]|uniref:hypothetical protein n=1 Tax=Streptomyces bambusae TaxID=1550616 RepID=UPI001CFF51BD|nr:hypothetical protein [Streptomyces bambusae]MCB5165358.1 hypothetical protein [Streptomyces bambusae]
MRTTVGAVAGLVAAAALLTGCGSDGGDTGTSGAGPAAESGPEGGSQSGSKGGAASRGAAHEVVLSVEGSGTTQVMYNAADSGFSQQTLPWKKTEKVELTAAEQRVGYLVSVIPGSVEGPDGRLVQAPCTITVDGRQVADNDGGKNPKGCSYTIK